MIRKMTKEDIPAVQEVDKICFNNNVNRRAEFIEAVIKDTDCLVYDDNGKIAGYILNHVRGSFAWFGTLGVHPDYRGKDIGKELVNETIEMFREKYNVKNIGLATIPNSGYNIGLYMNLGFVLKEMSLKLSKTISEDDTKANINESFKVEFVKLENEADYERIVKNAKEISESLYEGLDMSSELKIVRDSKMGIGFNLYEENELIGFGVLRNKLVLNGEAKNMYIRLLCIKGSVSSYTDAVNSVLHSVYSHAYKNGFQGVDIDVNAGYHKMCSHLLTNHGFKVDRTSVNLIMGDKSFYENMKGIIFYRTIT